MTVVARLKPAEPALQRGAPDGQLASIDLAAYAAQLGYPLLTGAYGQLASESPSVPQHAASRSRSPSTDEGTHLSYSLQWFAFGVLMFVGFGYAARQQARNAAIDAEDAESRAADGEFLHSSGPAARRRPARPEAEERHRGGRGRRHPGRPGILTKSTAWTPTPVAQREAAP